MEEKNDRIHAVEAIITHKRHRIAELEEIRRFEKGTERGLVKALQDIYAPQVVMVDAPMPGEGSKIEDIFDHRGLPGRITPETTGIVWQRPSTFSRRAAAKKHSSSRISSISTCFMAIVAIPSVTPRHW